MGERVNEAPDGMYIVKNGVTYQVTPRMPDTFKFAKKYNLMTGEVIYPTNADRIRDMTDEEMAKFLNDAESDGRAYGPKGKVAWLNWLKQECDT